MTPRGTNDEITNITLLPDEIWFQEIASKLPINALFNFMMTSKHMHQKLSTMNLLDFACNRQLIREFKMIHHTLDLFLASSTIAEEAKMPFKRTKTTIEGMYSIKLYCLPQALIDQRLDEEADDSDSDTDEFYEFYLPDWFRELEEFGANIISKETGQVYSYNPRERGLSIMEYSFPKEIMPHFPSLKDKPCEVRLTNELRTVLHSEENILKFGRLSNISIYASDIHDERKDLMMLFVGAIIFSMIIMDSKYGNKLYPYANSNTFGISISPGLLGKKVLQGKLPFKREEMNVTFFAKTNKNLSLIQWNGLWDAIADVCSPPKR